MLYGPGSAVSPGQELLQPLDVLHCRYRHSQRSHIKVAMQTVPKLGLVAKTAAYHRFSDSPTESTRFLQSRRLRGSAVRLEQRLPLAHLPSEPLLKPATATAYSRNPRHSASDMFELIKQAAAETRVQGYRTFQQQGLKIGVPLSADRASPRVASHPLLAKATVLGPPTSLWNQHPLLPVPTQRGSGVVYAVGRKNWLREHDQRIRVARVRRYRR